MRERERKFERDTFWSWIGQHLDLFTSSPSIAWWPKTGLCRNFCQFQSNFNFLTFNNTLKYFSQPKKASYKCKPFTDSFKCKNLELPSLCFLSIQHQAKLLFLLLSYSSTFTTKSSEKTIPILTTSMFASSYLSPFGSSIFLWLLLLVERFCLLTTHI